MNDSQPWRNQIVGSGEEDPEQMLAHPRNWRLHPQYQQDALAEILDKVGFVKPVIVNRSTGHVLDGHLRVTLAMRREEPLIPVSYVELSEAEEELVLATIDPLAELAIVDEERLQALVDDIKDDLDGEIRQMMSGFADLGELSSELSSEAQNLLLPASGDLPSPPGSPNGSEPSDQADSAQDADQRLLEITCPHCAADMTVDLDELERDNA
jgi:ParB-like chromosome segregation protein Spo0J